jgi:putative DNA primase/helicase
VTDYYEMLGVAPDASAEEVKSAYRKLARECHPDVSDDPAASERMKLLNEAHAVLGDQDRRAAYDEQRKSPGAGTSGTGDGWGSENLDGPVFPSPTAPLDVARVLFAAHYKVGGMRTLLAWRGGFMRWETTHWRELDVAELRSFCYAVLGPAVFWQPLKHRGIVVGYETRPWSPDKHKIAGVIEALAAIGHLSTDIDPPAWIDLHSAAASPAAQVISTKNGLLDMNTRTLHKHSPALFNLVHVPLAYDPDAPDPEPALWLDFLRSVWGDDEQSIALLQEFYGYVLSGRLDMQKMLVLIGPIRSGKGTIARTLATLMGGRRNVAGPTLASLGSNFGLSSLLGKPLAIISDARLGNAPSHIVVERLLSISGEDMLDVDRKFRDVWTGKLPTRFVMLSNELPKLKDSSGAIATRMLILQMTQSFLGREDHELDDKLQPELPGILAWALKGLDRLNSQGRFTVPQSSRDAAALMMDLASPTSAFVRECCVCKPDAEVSRDELFAAWKTWAENNGHRAGAKTTFGRDLRSVVPTVGQCQHKGVWYHTCIALLPVSPVSGDESAGQGVTDGTGNPVSEPASDQLSYGDTGSDTGSPVSDDATKSQVNTHDIGDTGKNTTVSPYESGHCTDCGAALDSDNPTGICSECTYCAKNENMSRVGGS